MDYEEYEKQCKEIRAENDNLLKIFEEDLKSKGLSEQTIGRHISNVDFYINEYLLREDASKKTQDRRRLPLCLRPCHAARLPRLSGRRLPHPP